MKPCNINSLYEKSCDLDFCFYCFIGEFLLMADRKVFFLVCKCPNQEHASEIDNFVTDVCFTRTAVLLPVNLMN